MKLEGRLSKDNINPHLLDIEYAVRGPLLQRAEQIQRELDKGVKKPFTKVIYANVGDCHALGQKPITFIRQVLSLVSDPECIASSAAPEDVKQRARELLADCTSGSVGSYSPPAGLRIVRRRGAEYLRKRDGGVPADVDDILLGAGATDLIRAVFQLINCPVDGKPPAVMVPVPQYPVFSGLLAELGVRRVDYQLSEDAGWALDPRELRRSWLAHAGDHALRAIVIINPGNPTGQVLSRENIEEVVRFAYEHGLLILADEVYQENIVCKPFHSFKKVMHEMGEPYASMDLCSLLTLSKGWSAECGLRAALAELRVCRDVSAVLGRARAVAQCPPVLGQCALDCVLRPPAPSEPSYAQFSQERSQIHRTLCARAAAAHAAFNDIPGYSCNTIDGAMFAFPRVEIPARAQAAAASLGHTPDEFYCLRLLEATGICVVPGSGFGQAAGSFHFRTTILHERDTFHHMLREFRRFHLMFREEFADEE
ncbi:alanine aminotransferase 1-like [Pectinophora gossypiella]|uniref:alanine aminotransferase 1-like n=1 Tax=Pectinophora gossypiella TaxID=13191 RepID=UPI00214E7B56|nr:alanine aminotransferase 1-like [Pectinophora gossypiella]